MNNFGDDHRSNYTDARQERDRTAYAITPMQHGMLAATLADPQSGVYVQQLCCTLSEKLKLAAFHRAWQELVQRHPVLRTCFELNDQDAPCQKVLDSFHLPVDEEDWRDLTRDQQEHRLQEYLRADLRRGFDFAEGPPVRVALFRTGQEGFQFVWTSHHALLDGRSRRLVLMELFVMYEAFCIGEEFQTVEQVPYRAYVDWFNATDFRFAETYWQKMLADLVAPTRLHLYRPTEHTVDASERFGTQRIRISRTVTSALRGFAVVNQVTLNNLLQGAWAILLGRYSGDEDVVFGATRACRKSGPQGSESMIGLLINTVPLRVRVAPQQSVSTLLQQLRREWTAMRDYEHTPLTLIHQWSDIPADSSLFESMVVFEEYELQAKLRSQGGNWTNREFQLHQRSNYPITVAGYDGPELLLEIGFDRKRFDDEAVDRLMGNLQTLLVEMARNASQRLSDLSIMSSDERQQMLVAWNDTQTTTPRAACIHEFFEGQAQLTPDAVAIVFENERLTYQELNAQANQLAWHLRSLGVGPESIVGVCVERSLEMVVGLLAILKAGGAYLPLDSADPEVRLRFVLNDANPHLLLTQKSTQSRLADCRISQVCLDTVWSQIGKQRCENPSSGATISNLAYVMYTSGSTGKPKAVAIPHRGVSRLLFGVEYARLDSQLRILQMAPLSFDASTFEIWGPLLHGGQCVVFPHKIPEMKRLGESLEHHRINTLWLTSSLFNAVIDEAAEILSGVEQLLVGGEVVSIAHIRRAVALLYNTQIINGYGPTEGTTFSCCFRIPSTFSDATSSIPIGRPIGNTTVYVLSSSMQPVPIGATGDLYIGGDGLARGYLNRPELTAARFVPHPFSNRPGDRLYKTGDRVRWLPDGNLDFVGRIDDQVKLRGFRIELGEVETALRSHPKVQTAVVLMREDTPGDKRLVAYCVPNAHPAPTPKLLRRHVAQRVPAYMIPAEFVFLESLPLTKNGKLDRRALPAPHSTRLDLQNGQPRSPTEELLLGIWSDVLGTDQIGIHDNLFEMGVNSLLATQVAARIQRLMDVEVHMSDLFASPTVAALAEHIPTNRRARPGPSNVAVPRPADENVPLSFGQQRIWFLDKLFPNSSTYNIPAAIQLKGTLNAAALERSIHEIIERHEVLRTTFVEEDGRTCQVISNHTDYTLDVIDLTQLEDELQQSEARRLASHEAKRPFNLQQGPLLRTTLLQLSEQHHVLLLTIHHIVFDGWSWSVFCNELAQLYTAFSAGKQSPLPDLPVQYADYARWQRQLLSHGTLDRQLAYWKKQLAGAPEELHLPADHPRPAMQTNKGIRHRLSLSDDLMAALETLCHQEEVTFFMTLLAAFTALLSRLCGQTDIIVGAPIAGRQQPETEDLIGMFINTLVLRTDLSDNPTFQQQLYRAKAETLAAFENQDVPFEKLVEELKPRRDLSRAPLVQVLINVISLEGLDLVLPGLETEWLTNESPESKFDLILRLSKTAKRTSLMIDYNRDLFEARTIARMASDLEQILQSVSANPQQRVSDLPVSTDSHDTPDECEARAILPDPRVVLDEPILPPAGSLIADWADRVPQQPAVCQDGRQWTYRELLDCANSLARHLIAHGIRPGEFVAVTGPKSFGLIASMVGLLRSGAVMVPIDPSLPSERKRLMSAEAAASKTVIIQDGDSIAGSATDNKFFVSAANGRLINAAANQDMQTVAIPEVKPNDAAYVFFTSGSTGKPKGILGCHKGLSHFLQWQRDTFAIGPRDRVAQLTSLSFDVILRDVFLPLTSGATVCLPPASDRFEVDDVLPWLERERLTVLHTVPSLAELWLSKQRSDVSLTEMRWVFFAGEPLTGELVNRWRTTCTNCAKIVNFYGPTEMTMVKCWYQVPAEVTPGIQPIGHPLPQTQALVLDGQRRTCNLGEAGEIVLRTPFCTLGYLNSAGIDQQGFVRNPFRNDDRDLLYFTGDRGRYRADGVVEILGRLDEQVKIRGVRVEPTEVMATLKQHASVRSCFVTATRDRHDQNCLVAYVVVENHDEHTIAALRSFLGARLPAAMMPSTFVFLDRLPLTTNGKVDRAALPSPDQSIKETRPSSREPMSSTEDRLIAIWREVLEQDRISRHDDFFTLGGHSLLALQLLSRIRITFKIDLPLRRLFEAPTVESLANLIENLSQQEPSQFSNTTSAEPNEQPAFFETVAGCIHQQFEMQAQRTPDVVAVVCEDQQLTYQQLNERSNQLARFLRTLDIGPEVRVGLCMERSLEIMVGLLAILKAGGAYVPLDPGAPKDRIGYLLDDANIDVLISLKPLAGQLPISRVRAVYLDTQWNVVAQNNSANLVANLTNKNAAYVIYTSGSTGHPKGVVVDHQSVMNYVHGVVERTGWQAPLSFAMVQPLTFDSSVTSIYPPLFTGGTLHLITEKRATDSDLLGEYFDKFLIDCLKITPTHLAALQTSSHPRKVLPRRTLIIGGEASHWQRVEQLRAIAARECTIFNHYGPTEATVGVLMYRIEEAPADQRPTLVPIGRPLANSQVYVLDRQLQPVPPGEIGELYIGGDCVARGYFNRPEMTAASFIPNPFDRKPGSRLYKSGDLARCRHDGNVEFLGRIDDQLKIRGYRIEPGEVEAILVQHPAVRESLVMGREDARGDLQLVGYVVFGEEPAPSMNALRKYLREKLPTYMVPATFVTLSALPRTKRGKVDRRALPAPEWQHRDPDLSFTPPSSELEKTIASIWCQLLNVDTVGIEDNFFELGGHSLVAIQVIERLRKTLGILIPVHVLFEAQTVAELAHFISKHGPKLAEDGMDSPRAQSIPRRDQQDGIPPSYAQQRMWFQDQLELDCALHNVSTIRRLQGNLDVSALERALNEIVRRHEVLRTNIVAVDGQPVQRIRPPLDRALEIVDLRELPKAVRERQARELSEQFSSERLELACDPLIRYKLLRLADQDHVLLLILHHVVTDHWSQAVLFRELATLYNSFLNGKPSPLSELPIQYADFAVWQRKCVEQELLAEQLPYWKEQLRDLPRLEFPTDFTRPSVPTFRGATQSIVLPDQLTEALRELSQREGVTLSMTLLAALKVLFHRYSGQDDIVVGTPVAARDRIEIEGLIGYFINVLILRTDLSGRPRFRELLKRVQQTATNAYAHQEIPFEKIVEQLQPQRDFGRTPLSQVLFNAYDFEETPFELTGVSASRFPTDGSKTEFDLTLYVRRRKGKIHVHVEYNVDLFRTERMTRMLDHYRGLLQSVTRDPEQRISELSLPLENEESQLAVSSRETAINDPPHALRGFRHELDEAKRSPAFTADPSGTTPQSASTINTLSINDETLSTMVGSVVPSTERTTPHLSDLLRIERRPLLPLFAMGKLAPVDAVAFGYLSDQVYLGTEGRRDEILDAWCEGLPTLARVFQTFLGRIAVVRLPWYGSTLYDDQTKLVTDACDALELAGQIGARAVSLTGLIPSATKYGRAIASATSNRPDLPVITTGHATTVATVILTIQRTLEEAARELIWEHVGFLGLGSIGRATLRLMLQCLPHPDRITLCDVYSNINTLQQLQQELVDQRGFRGDVRVLESRGNAPEDFYDASFIVGATNVSEVLDVNRLRPGTIVVDDSAPHCFSIDDAIRRFQEQKDILCTAGGVLRSPQPNSLVRHIPRRANALLPRELKQRLSNYNPYHITGCVFASLLTARFDEVEPTLGIVDDRSALQFYKLLGQLNFQAADLHFGPFFPAAESIAGFRTHFNSTKSPHRNIRIGSLKPSDSRMSGEVRTQQEQRQIMVDGNQTSTETRQDACFQQLFEEQAERTPEAEAVVFENEQLTYRALNERANQLAHHLQRLGVSPGCLVGLCVERSLEMMVGLLGILKAGGAYVPLDPGYPRERLSYMLEDARVSALVTHPNFVGELLDYDVPTICLERDWQVIQQENINNPQTAMTTSELAYVIYTSGSTGHPKGVAIPHGALVNLLTAMCREPGLTADDVLVAVSTLSFDIAALELFLPLLVGARVVIASRDVVVDGHKLAGLLNASGATSMQATPTTWQMLLASGWSGQAPLKVLCGGEVLPRELANALLQRVGSVWNMYGPTETTIWSSIHKVAMGTGPVSIGRPIANTQIYILNERLQPAPVGVPGELFIGGNGLARGYWNRPDLTASHYHPNSFSEGRLYRTGDLACWQSDGNIRFLGRKDQQVKLRGFRIELGEIERWLLAHNQVREAAVVLHELQADDARLVAFVVASGESEPTSAALRAYLVQNLPDYMIPSSFVVLDAMPLTPNGKVDRKALSGRRLSSAEQPRSFVSPRDHLERQLVDIWQEVLHVGQISVSDNFFHLGGHSLLAMRLVARIAKQLGQEIRLADLLRAPSVEELAKVMRARSAKDCSSPLIGIRTAGSKRPFFCVHPASGHVYCYGHLSRQLGVGQPFYGIEHPELNGERDRFNRIEDLAVHYIRAIRTVQPQGPYLLGGWSMGGVVAFEMSRQLQLQGERIDVLALLDTYFPNNRRTNDIDDRVTQLRKFALVLGVSSNDLELNVPEFSQLPWEEQLQKILSMVRSADTLPEEFDFEQFLRHFQVFESNVRAISNYIPQRYAGRLVTFLATEEPTNSGFDGWAHIVEGEITSHLIPGNHFTMLQEPNVHVLGQHLKKLLQDI